MIQILQPRFTVKKKNDNFELYAYYGNVEIGFCAVYEYMDYVRVDYFSVYERYRNQGIGSAIINHVEHHFKKDILLCCYKENSANEFYRKLGFVSDGEDEEFYHYIKEV